MKFTRFRSVKNKASSKRLHHIYVPHSQAAPHEQLIPPSAGFCIDGQPQGTHSAFGGWLHPASADKVSDVVNIGKFMKKYWKCKIMRQFFWSQWEKNVLLWCVSHSLSNRWISFRPLTDHAEVLTDYIGILKYPNRQKVICTLYCKIKSKFLFLWTIRIEPTLKRADFFVSLIQFMPMSKTYIPKMGPKKAALHQSDAR